MSQLIKLCLAVAVTFHPFAAGAQAAPATIPALSAAQIDAAVGQYYKPNEPGAVILVAKDGKTIFRKAYGLADAAKGTPMTADMQLRVGSFTKQFTSTAILLLVDEGKIKLDDDITRYLPDYPTKGKRITVGNLLNHTSGIVSFTSKPGYLQHMAEDMTAAAIIDTYKNDPLEFEPGTRYKYNNSGYQLLGVIIEKVSGQPYADFLEQRIFKPLDMNDTAYEGKEHGKAIRAAGHSRGADGFRPAAAISMTQPFSAGALVSTVDDLARWDAAVSSGKLLKPATWQRAFAKTTLADGKLSAYGYGWGLGAVRGVPTIEHGGGINGFSAYVLRVPSEHVYVVVLRNTDGGTADTTTVARVAAATAIGKPYPQRTAVTLDAAALEAFAGTYKIDEASQRIVRRDGDKLRMQRTNRPPVMLTPFSATGFFVRGEVDWFEFTRNATGELISLTVHRDDADEIDLRTGGAPASEN
ncbi:MAG: serine hydrolase [Pseudomonadota bacterium]|nr:serine hydrolase [Pseudomonadota bacterium]